LAAWEAFQVVVSEFLGNNIAKNYKEIVKNHMLQKIDLQTLKQLEEKKLKKNGKNKRANKSSCTLKNVHSFDEEDPMAETTIVKLQQLITFIVRDDNFFISFHLLQQMRVL
jgi:hypothetical protein